LQRKGGLSIAQIVADEQHGTCGSAATSRRCSEVARPDRSPRPNRGLAGASAHTLTMPFDSAARGSADRVTTP
jgi:hypothetical protein